MKHSAMSLRQLSSYGLLAVACLLIGFVFSLILHWSLRPSSEAARATLAEAELRAAQTEVASGDVLRQKNEALKIQVGALEQALDRQTELNAISEGHARALVNELQQFRQDRDRLFAELEARNAKLENKINELDQKISEQIAAHQSQDAQLDTLVLQSDLNNLLNYPHALNDVTLLNTALLETPLRNRELIEQRFELIMQPPRFDYIDQVEQQLASIHQTLNKRHENNTRLHWVHCTDGGCEVQVAMQQKEAFFDYGQEWLDETSTLPLLKQRTEFFIETHNGEIWVILQSSVMPPL